LHPSNPRLAEVWGVRQPTRSGVDVTPDTALTFAAIYRAVSLISECAALLSKKTYRRADATDDNDRETARKHPSYRLLNVSPDGIRSSFSFFESLTQHALLVGNGYAEIVRDGRGRAAELHLLEPSNVSVRIDSKTGRPQYYIYSPSRARGIELGARDIFHLRAPSWDGLIGKAPITRARESIGVALASEEHIGRYFTQGGTPPGFLTRPNRIGDKERKRIQREWEEMHAGLENAHRVGVLSGGWDWKPTGMSLKDMEFVQLRLFQVSEVARWFGVPPHMLADLSKSTFDNIEHMLIEFVTFTMLPWVKRWESECNMKLFTPDEQFTYYVEFDMDSLLRGDSLSRAEALERELRNGALTPDEWRAKQNRPAYPDGIGSKPLIMASQLMTLEDVANGVTMMPKPGTSHTEDEPSPQRKAKPKPKPKKGE